MNNVDKVEVERFGAIAAEWWNPRGKFRTLHQINPGRLTFLREQSMAHQARGGLGARPFTGLTILDVGCGGGLIAEPLARLGATVTGLDPAEENIAVARSHAAEQGLAGLMGHRSVGGCRASIYNATPIEAVQALIDFMTDFEKRAG